MSITPYQPLDTSRSALGPEQPSRKLARVLLMLLLAPVVLVVVALVGYTVVFFKPDQSTEALSEHYAQAPSQFIELESAGTFHGGPLKVHLRDIGPRSGVPVVLLSGTASALYTWNAMMEPLAANHRVIAIDLPGYGLSEGFSDKRYSSEGYARFLLALLDRLGIQRCLLVGHDFGGEVAWQTAYKAPDRVSRLVLISSTGYPSDPWKRALDDQLMRSPVTGFIERHARSHFIVRKALEDRFAHPERVTDAQVQMWFDLPLHEGNRAAQRLRKRMDTDGREADRIKKLQLPTLIVWGENDRQIPAQQAYWFKRDIAESKLVKLPDVGHLPQEEAADTTAQTVLDFVDR